MPEKVDTIRFVIYSRSYCHLCEDMRDALQAELGATPAGIDMIDVDTDPALVELYDELVPVLVGLRGQAPGVRLCHYHLDREALRAFLAAGKTRA
ncbi:glutaredoxin family protein [Herbaspirillum sp. LeCh32-8]|uniref:glutaredoxin family protein n=1 Tax=Herbaspirillum sp. LeCh32-8 TaxID=2821356 RepID=UPI001AE6923B|nr:glutaredoxin family protein [Herbaspirillum sp. LeCh32-8]MBP0596857.1 glutaredoxin family protein [Herbaspirillum sp. LeCh32-8]